MPDDFEAFVNLAMQGLNLPPDIKEALFADPGILAEVRQEVEQTLSKEPTKVILREAEQKKLIKDAQEALEHERSLPVVKAQVSDRQQLIDNIESRRHLQVKFGERGYVIEWKGVSVKFSSTPIAQLRRITFDEIYVLKRHHGSLLLARIISLAELLPMLRSAVKSTDLTCVIEDPAGRAQTLIVKNFPLPGVETGPDLDAMLPLGRYLAIREPEMKRNEIRPDEMRREQHIRVDSPTDFILLSSSGSLLDDIEWSSPSPAEPLPSSFDYKQHGNALLKKKKYLLAVKSYSDGLSATTSDEKKLLLHLNRSQAHLFLRNHASAFRDTSAVLSLLSKSVSSPPQTEYKVNFRRARALEGLRKLDLALKAYEEVLRIEPANAAGGQEGRNRVAKMLEQSGTGQYDWRELKAGGHGDGINDTTREFFGPIEVVELEGRGGGRGVVATRDIGPGERILVEKAFAIGRRSDNGPQNHVYLNLRVNCHERSPDVALLRELIARAVDDPSVAQGLYSLYGGPGFEPLSMASLDFLSKREISDTYEPVDVDVSRIEEIATQNVFGIETSSRDPKDRHSALFLGASLFNQSHAENTSREFDGDVMIIRTLSTVKKGQELFVFYGANPDPTQTEGTFATLHSKDGVCQCDFCENLAKRRELVEKRLPPLEALHLSARTAVQLRTLESHAASLVSDLEATYRPDFRAVRV